MGADKVIEVRHLSKAFGKHVQIERCVIDFTVSSGDVTCIIGASGSGKSTLLRCINMLETPTTGEILFHEKNITDRGVNVPQYRSKVGMVFQQFNLFNNMTVLENCMVGQTKVLKKKKEEAHKSAMYYLEKVGMAPYINARPRQISGGQKQRVAIAGRWPWNRRCCCSTSPLPRWIPRWWERCWRSCGRWQRKGLTMIIVTHEMAFARDVSSHVVFMADGIIEEEGTPEQLFGSPKKAKTQEFLSRFRNG